MVWLLLASLWLWMSGIAVAGVQLEFPNPLKDFRLCGRRNASFVCDPEFLMDIGDVDRLEHLTQEFQRTTSCLCSPCKTGISLGIFIRRNLTQDSAQLYQNGRGVAAMLRKRWNMGKCEDDILIIVLTELNISDYSMGSAVKDIFPEETAKKIMKECTIHFVSGYYYQGLESVVNSFSDVLTVLQKKKNTRKTNLIVGVCLGIGVLFILLFITSLILRRNKRRNAGCSNIYESVPTSKTPQSKYLSEKVNEFDLEKMNKQSSSDEDDEEGYMSDEDNTTLPSKQLLQVKRQLSAVTEESYSDDNETFEKEIPNLSFNSVSNSTPGRSQQVTEL